MSNVVEYILNLRSNQFESGMESADRKARWLNATMGGLVKTAAGFVSAFAAANYLRNSVVAYNESEQALAQLNATLKSTGGAAGIATEAMQAQAKALQAVTTYDDDAIIGMQSLLATFTNIHGEVFDKTVPVILDLSQKMGQDLKSSAVQVGKALNDPVKGLSALSRVGVNFNAQQEKTIKGLMATNRVAEAQTIILKELQKEFGGSAEAAALVGTGPMVQLQNQMGDVNEEVGKLTLNLVKGLLPTIKSTVSGLQVAAEWMNKNSIAIGGLAKGVTGFLLVARGVPAVMTAFGASATALAAAGGPITILAAALGTIAYGYDLVTKSAERTKEAIKLEREERNAGVKKTSQNALKFMLSGKGERLGLPSKLEDIQSRAGLAEVNNRRKLESQKAEALRLAEVYRLNPDAYLKYSMQAEEIEKKIKDEQYQLGLFRRVRKGGAAGKNGPGGGGAPGSPLTDTMKTQATGSKAVTINVTIGDLIKTFNINTTNLKEGARSAKEQVQAALMGAVNDFQIVAAQ